MPFKLLIMDGRLVPSDEARLHISPFSPSSINNPYSFDYVPRLTRGLAPVSWTGTDLGFKHSAAATVSSRS